MEDDTNMQKTQFGIYHLSVGSAATGIHLSMDIAADDPDYVKKVDDFLNKWAMAAVAVAVHRARGAK